MRHLLLTPGSASAANLWLLTAKVGALKRIERSGETTKPPATLPPPRK